MAPRFDDDTTDIDVPEYTRGAATPAAPSAPKSAVAPKDSGKSPAKGSGKEATVKDSTPVDKADKAGDATEDRRASLAKRMSARREALERKNATVRSGGSKAMGAESADTAPVAKPATPAADQAKKSDIQPDSTTAADKVEKTATQPAAKANDKAGAAAASSAPDAGAKDNRGTEPSRGKRDIYEMLGRARPQRIEPQRPAPAAPAASAGAATAGAAGAGAGATGASGMLPSDPDFDPAAPSRASLGRDTGSKPNSPEYRTGVLPASGVPAETGATAGAAGAVGAAGAYATTGAGTHPGSPNAQTAPLAGGNATADPTGPASATGLPAAGAPPAGVSGEGNAAAGDPNEFDPAAKNVPDNGTEGTPATTADSTEDSASGDSENRPKRGTQSLGLLLLRMFLGAMLLVRGLQTLFALGGDPGLDALQQQWSDYNGAEILAVAIPSAEIIAGGLLIFGLMTPFAGAVAAVVAGFLTLDQLNSFQGSLWPYGLSPYIHTWLLMGVIALAVIFAGPGGISLDRKRAWNTRPLVSAWLFAIIAVAAVVALWLGVGGGNPFN